METTTKPVSVNGHIRTEPIENSEIKELEENSEFVLVYHPNYTGASTPVFWAKRVKDSALLFSYDTKSEIELVKIEDLRKLIFITEEGAFSLKWQQWARAIESNLVDSNRPIKAFIVPLGTKNVARIIPPKDLSEEALLSRICKGFPTKKDALSYLRTFGYKLEKVEPLNQFA